MRRSSTTRALATLVLIALGAVHSPPAHATSDIVVLFSSLPSAQGWTYVNSGVAAPETPTWSLAGSTLAYDTMPYAVSGTTTGTSSCYRMTGLVTATEPIQIEMRGRVLSHESDGSALQGGGFSFAFGVGGTHWQMGVLPGQIRNIAGTVLSTAYDNTQFHTYRLDWTPPSTLAYYVDGALISTNGAGAAGGLNFVQFGDGTFTANARAEITYFRFRQYPGATPAANSSWGRVKALYR